MSKTTGKTPGSSRSIRHHPGPSRWHTVQPPVLPGSPRSMDRGEPGSTGSPVGLGHNEWKMANVIPLPKTKPIISVETDIRPTDVLNNYVRVVLLDFSKAFDLINHHILVDKLITNGVPAHIVRWLAAFLLDRQQQVKIGNIYSRTGIPNGGVPQGTLSGPKCFLLYINDLETHVPLFKYVDDSTLFEICNTNEISENQESIDKAADWTSMNCMKINSKSQRR